MMAGEELTTSRRSNNCQKYNYGNGQYHYGMWTSKDVLKETMPEIIRNFASAFAGIALLVVLMLLTNSEFSIQGSPGEGVAAISMFLISMAGVFSFKDVVTNEIYYEANMGK